MPNQYLGEFSDLQQGLFGVLDALQYAPEVIVRGLKTKEIHPCSLTINNPLRRTLLYPKRGNNPFAALAEAMWVLGGWNNINWLERFLPRAKDFSDDGKIWRSGYGARLRHATGTDDTGNVRTVDQLRYIYETLTKDCYSRQAVITIWDPAKECTIGNSRDFPCNDLLQFLYREDKLDLHVYVRSNDAIWGFAAINIYEWTVLQEIMAGLLGFEVGKLHYFVGSMHVYEKHFEKIKELRNTYIDLDNAVYKQGVSIFRFHRKQITYNELFNDIGRFLQHSFNTNAFLLNDTSFSCEALNDIANLLRSYLVTDCEHYYQFMDKVPMSDLKLACHWWTMKQEEASATVEDARICLLERENAKV